MLCMSFWIGFRAGAFVTEHFCTLFDSNFLPFGMALHRSLTQHAGKFQLWVICLDEKVEAQLRELNLPNVSLIPLREIETPEILTVKPTRNRAEYCWTLSPFTYQAVLERDASVDRVTYLDADLFFFDSPKSLFQELEESNKDVFITEHAYDPEYDQSSTSGRFCVQFITFRRTEGGWRVMRWWQERCVEWCFARHEDGKFGDQKYLDQWPKLFGEYVHVLKQSHKALAPWNVNRFDGEFGADSSPVFYHFHSSQIVAPEKIRLFSGYRLQEHSMRFYDKYLLTLKAVLQNMHELGMKTPFLPPPERSFQKIRVLKAVLSGRERYADLT